MEDEINEKIPVTDGEGNVIYESNPFFVDNNSYMSQAYPGTPATLKQYSIDFGGRAVSSIKCIAEVKTVSIDYTGGGVQPSASVSLSTSSGIEIGSASNGVGKGSIINANAKFQQFLTEIVIVVKGTCPASTFASSSYTSINYLRVYLPEQLLS